jgi:superfamily II DNA/RNA helicase
MQNQNNSQSRGSGRSRSGAHSRPSFSRGGGGFRSSGSRFGGGSARPHGRGFHGSRPARRKNANPGENLDPSLFVSKAVVVEEVERTFVPEHRFSDFAVDERLKTNITRKGYEMPTPIQDRTIPHILMGRDVIGLANTGTGKTAAFLIPLIDKVLKNPKEQVLIMVPTRELAIQIEEEFQGFSRLLGLFSACCVGGTSIEPQLRALRHKNQFVIGTPGRLKDLMDRGALDLRSFRSVVLDEADRMLDMGFIGDMRFILAHTPEERHTLFFSATMSKEIEALVGEFLRDPVTISVKTRDTSKNVDQDVVRLAPGQDKIDVLHDLLVAEGFDKVIVFGRTKHGVQKLAQELSKRGFKADAIHGNKTHAQRQRALRGFKDGSVKILVATDVAARGLDIPNVSHVINYDVPGSYDDYVHRIGRTGRGDKVGKALTFVTR